MSTKNNNRKITLEVVTSDLSNLMDLRHNNDLVMGILWWNFLVSPGIILGYKYEGLSEEEKNSILQGFYDKGLSFSEAKSLIDHDALLYMNKSAASLNKLMATRFWSMREGLYPKGGSDELDSYLANIDTMHSKLSQELKMFRAGMHRNCLG